jgi:hypothetical protein
MDEILQYWSHLQYSSTLNWGSFPGAATYNGSLGLDIPLLATHACGFTGISCDLSGHITHIELGHEPIYAIVPDRAISQLRSLQVLNLTRTFVFGTINWLNESSNSLETVDLSLTSLSGDIPIFPPSLKTLDLLWSNLNVCPFAFNGSLTSCILLVSPLQVVCDSLCVSHHVAQSCITGNICAEPAPPPLAPPVSPPEQQPQTIQEQYAILKLIASVYPSLRNLSYQPWTDEAIDNACVSLSSRVACMSPMTVTRLSLSHAGLTGAFSSLFKLIQPLSFLDVSHNQLSGTLDPSALNGFRLNLLDVSFNSFSGQIPPEATNSAWSFFAQNNAFTGTIPNSRQDFQADFILHSNSFNVCYVPSMTGNLFGKCDLNGIDVCSCDQEVQAAWAPIASICSISLECYTPVPTTPTPPAPMAPVCEGNIPGPAWQCYDAVWEVLGPVSLNGLNSTSGSIYVSGTTTITPPHFTVGGRATFSDYLTINPTASIAISSGVYIGAALTVGPSGSFMIYGNLEMGGGIYAHAGSYMYIQGIAFIQGGIVAGPQATIYFRDNTGFQGGIYAPDDADISITGNAGTEGDLYLGLNSTLLVFGDLNVFGSATLIGARLQVSGNLYIAGDFAVNDSFVSFGTFGYPTRSDQSNADSVTSFNGDVTFVGGSGLAIGASSRVTTTGHITLVDGAGIAFTLPADLLDIGRHVFSRAGMHANRARAEELRAPPRLRAEKCVNSNGALFLEIDSQGVQMLIQTARATKSNLTEVVLVDSSGASECEGSLSSLVIATIADSPDDCSLITASSKLDHINGRSVLTAVFEVDSSVCVGGASQRRLKDPQNSASSKAGTRAWLIFVGSMVGIVGMAAIVLVVVLLVSPLRHKLLPPTGTSEHLEIQ